MRLLEAIIRVLQENNEYTDPSTNFDVQVKRSSDAKFIQKVVGSFTNEHGKPVNCTIGFVNDYTVELGIAVDSERIADAKGMFKSLKACSEFYTKFLNGLLERIPRQDVRLVYFDQENPLGGDIHDTLIAKVVAPAVRNILDDEWEEVGRKNIGKGKSVFLWQRQVNDRSHKSISAKQGPGMEPSWYKSKRPHTSDINKMRSTTTADHDEFQNQSDKITNLKSKMYSKECAIRMNQIGIELRESLLKQFL